MSCAWSCACVHVAMWVARKCKKWRRLRVSQRPGPFSPFNLEPDCHSYPYRYLSIGLRVMRNSRAEREKLRWVTIVNNKTEKRRKTRLQPVRSPSGLVKSSWGVACSFFLRFPSSAVLHWTDAKEIYRGRERERLFRVRTPAECGQTDLSEAFYYAHKHKFGKSVLRALTSGFCRRIAGFFSVAAYRVLVL